MEVQKNDNRRPMPSCLGCFGYLFFFCFGCFGALVFLVPFIAKIRQTELAPERIPTAEALLDVPEEIEFDGIRLRLTLVEDYGRIWNSSSEATDIICINAFASRTEGFQDYSSLFINDGWVLGASDVVFLGMDGGLSLEPIYPTWCAAGELQPGIHLIEFHLKDSFWGEPIHIQQWAIEIE